MPTYYGAKDVGFLLVSGRSILSAVGDIGVEREAVVTNTTPLGSTWPTFALTGDKKASISQNGWFDAASGGTNDAICEREGTNQVVCVAHTGNTAGRTVFCAAGSFAGKYSRILAANALHKAKASYTVNGYAEDGVILQALATLTTAANTDAASVNNGGATTSGGAGYLQVTGLTLGGYTDLTVKVRHSADNITFTDLLTFTAVTAIGGECKTVAGTVNQYLSTSRAWTGSGTGQTTTMMVAFARR